MIRCGCSLARKPPRCTFAPFFDGSDRERHRHLTYPEARVSFKVRDVQQNLAPLDASIRAAHTQSATASQCKERRHKDLGHHRPGKQRIGTTIWGGIAPESRHQ
jgi:hypothetical protein